MQKAMHCINALRLNRVRDQVNTTAPSDICPQRNGLVCDEGVPLHLGWDCFG